MISKIHFYMLTALFVILYALAFTFTGWAQLNDDIVQIKPFLSVDKVQPGSKFQMAFVVQIKNGWHIQAHKPSEDLIPTELILEPILGLRFNEIVYPEPTLAKLFADEPLKVYEGKIILSSNVSSSKDLKIGKQTIRGRLKYQACTDVICNIPAEKRFEFSLSSIGLNSAKGSEGSEGSESSGGLSNRLISSFSDAVQRNWLKAFLIVFLAGMLTSLTPCVYPMIPITIGVIGARASEDKLKGFITSLVYVFGIALVYSSFGVVAASTGAAFGSLGQNIYIVGAVSLIFFLMGLSMFDLFVLQLPTSIAAKLQNQKMRGLAGVFIMGGITGIVASPCVGPVLVGVLAFVSQSGNIFLGFSLLFTFAMGIGVLFLILGTSTSAALPKAGTWMESIKKFLGSALIVTPLFLLNPFLSPTVNHWLRAILLVPLGAFLGAFNPMTENSSGIEKLAKAFGILLVAVGLLSLTPIFLPNIASLSPSSSGSGGSTQADSSTLAWVADLEKGLSQAKAEDKLTMIDFYADWCIACKELDEKTYSDPKVRKALKDFVPVKIDATNSGDEKVKSTLSSYKVLGLPTVIFLNSLGQEILRFTEFQKPQQFLKTVDEAIRKR